MSDNFNFEFIFLIILDCEIKNSKMIKMLILKSALPVSNFTLFFQAFPVPVPTYILQSYHIY